MSERLRVVGYVRCSSQEQVDGMSLDAQRARLAAWAEAIDAELVEVIEDAAISGTKSLSDRPGGCRLASLLESRKPWADAILVIRLDRLGRDAAETLGLLRKFANGPVGLISIADRLDLTTPQGRAMAGMAAVFGELERDLIAQRTAEALSALRAQKRVYGRLPFGWDSENGLLVENADEQRVLSRVRRLRLKEASYRAIALKLNAQGVPAKRGGPWHAMTVRSVLRTSEALSAC